MTKKKEKAVWYPAYREVVYEWLMFYYGIPQPSARAITDAWWRRLKKISAYESGIFLHDEPSHTAQDLIGKGPCTEGWETERERVFTPAQRAEYERLQKFYWDKFEKRFKKKRKKKKTSGIIK